YMICIFSSVAWNNIGYIDWEPWLSKIFTRTLHGFSLPISKIKTSSITSGYIISYIAKWIIAIKNFYHPSDTEDFQEKLVEFLVKLAEYFVDRVHLENQVDSLWFISLHKSSRLTEENIIDFVNCIKEYVFISIFNKNYGKKAAEACRYLSILRPELIVPIIIEKHFSSIDNITEPHRFISIMNCLTCLSRSIVQQTLIYSQGQIYVISLLMSVLPGIDLNETSIILDFLNSIFKLIICSDCSLAIEIRNDLTDIEILSTDISNDNDIEYISIQSKLISIISNIVQQRSKEIFQIIREKIIDFVSCPFLSVKARKLVCGLVLSIVKCNPDEIIKYLLPKTYNSIEKLMNTFESNVLLTDHKGDIELIWYSILFSELLHARGSILFIYKQMIMCIFHRYISIINKDAYQTIANAANHLLKSFLTFI
ncbi:unnamed protein product, partial [Rotaria sp. Silwood1]